jgi:hypothetical protein
MSAPIFRWRHLILLIALLALVGIGPSLIQFARGLLILNLIGAGVLVAGSYAISDRKQLFFIGLALSLLSVIATSLAVFRSTPVTIVLAHSCALVLLGFFAVSILLYALRRGRVTADKIFAAICAYLLIGYGWAFAYAILDELHPGAFSAPTTLALDDFTGRVMQMRYFSFITLTTVGYGDIVPRSQEARTLVIFEAILGQFYLVVLVGRLVSLHIVHGTPEPSNQA